MRKKRGVNINIDADTTMSNGGLAFVNKNLNLDGQNIKLTKILLDGQDTVFYFDNLIDFKTDYTAKLIDENGKYYGINHHFMNYAKDNNIGKILAFEPLDDGIRQFRLELINNKTSNVTILKFKMNDFLTTAPYVEAYNLGNHDNFDINFESIRASAAGTFIDYTLRWDPSANYYYGIDNYNNGGAYLYTDSKKKIVPSKTNTEINYNFLSHNTMLIEGIYVPLNDYKSEMSLVLDNIYKIFPINLTYSAQEMLSPNANINIPVDNYNLVIEGMQQNAEQGMAVIVYHVTNNEPATMPSSVAADAVPNDSTADASKDISANSGKNFTVKKVPLNDGDGGCKGVALLDASIVIHGSDGKDTIVKDFTTNAGIQDANLVGDLVFNDPELKNLTPNNFDVIVNSIKVKDSDYEADMDLALVNNNNGKTVDDIKKAIQNSFNQRLAYKSSEFPKLKINGFDESVLNDEKLEGLYEPVNLTNASNYSSLVTVTSISPNDQMLCVVQESWNGNTGDGFKQIFNTHKVVYDIKKKLIISDEIIN